MGTFHLTYYHLHLLVVAVQLSRINSVSFTILISPCLLELVIFGFDDIILFTDFLHIVLLHLFCHLCYFLQLSPQHLFLPEQCIILFLQFLIPRQTDTFLLHQPDLLLIQLTSLLAHLLELAVMIF